MRGKKIYANNKSVFVQIDKNNQVCQLWDGDDRVYPEVMNIFRGRPLYTAWNELKNILVNKMSNETKEKQ